MSEPRGSIVVTCVLCVALFAGNLYVGLHGMGMLSYVVLWPAVFVLCTVIFARIMRGHSTL